MKVGEIVEALEEIAPLHLAAEWDNVGLLVGDRASSAGKVLLCIDLTAAVLAEARRVRADFVMAYHPVIFHPTSRLTASETPVAYAAAAGGLSVYSMHTALDVAPGGTNDCLAEVLGIVDPRPIETSLQDGNFKVVVFTPPSDVSRVGEAAFDAGGGRIANCGNYSRCAFFSHGVGTFLSGAGSKPAIGQPGRQEVVEELRLELVVPAGSVAAVCSAIRSAHSYEVPAIDVYPLKDTPAGCGQGRVGRLARPVSSATLIRRIKQRIGVKRVARVAPARQAGRSADSPVSIAACGAGSCGDLFRSAVAAGASFYLTGEMRHHDALAAAAAGLEVVCVGHSNSERMAMKGLAKRLTTKLPAIKVAISKADRDPFEFI